MNSLRMLCAYALTLCIALALAGSALAADAKPTPVIIAHDINRFFTYQEAQAFCAAKNGRLPKVSSVTQNTRIEGFQVGKNSLVWPKNLPQAAYWTSTPSHRYEAQILVVGIALDTGQIMLSHVQKNSKVHTYCVPR